MCFHIGYNYEYRLKKKKIDKKNYNIFFNSINTISKEFQSDIRLYKNNKLSKNKIVEKYGHLRPGTYDITSPRYDEKLDLFLKDPGSKKLININLNNKELIFNKKFLDELAKIGFNDHQNNIIDFFFGSIEKRESSKFLFTKYLSEILKIISKELNKTKLSNHDISMLSIQ